MDSGISQSSNGRIETEITLVTCMPKFVTGVSNLLNFSSSLENNHVELKLKGHH